MKINWGTGITITIVLFAGLMAFMVYMSVQQDFELVSENYYEEELRYQEIIDKKKNALQLEGRAGLSIEEDGIYLQLPSDLQDKQKEVNIYMYHEQGARFDFETEVAGMENKFAIPFESIHKGKWIAKVNVNCEGVDYYFDPEITL